MVAIAILAAWADYSVFLWGWCLLRGYDVTMGQLMSPLHPYDGPWPPGQIPPGQVFPSGKDQPQTGNPGGYIIGGGKVRPVKPRKTSGGGGQGPPEQAV